MKKKDIIDSNEKENNVEKEKIKIFFINFLQHIKNQIIKKKKFPKNKYYINKEKNIVLRSKYEHKDYKNPPPQIFFLI